MPKFETHAPKGWMGDAERGAAMGRPTIGPDPRSAATLEALFIDAVKRLDWALRLKDARPADEFKPHAWEAAAQAAREDKEEFRTLFKAAKAREEVATSPTVKICLRRVRLNGGGFDSCGAYWGQGEPLYWAASDTVGVEYDSTFRANNRAHAKAQVRETFPNATFYN